MADDWEMKSTLHGVEWNRLDEPLRRFSCPECDALVFFKADGTLPDHWRSDQTSCPLSGERLRRIAHDLRNSPRTQKEAEAALAQVAQEVKP